MRLVNTIGSIAVAAVVLAACAPGTNTGSQANQATTTVTRGAIDVGISSSGTVEPLRSVDLLFGTSGTVEQVFVEAGMQVTAGQVLASLDTRDLDQQVVQSEANLASAKAQLEQTKSGNATPEQIAQQAAAVRQAQANLEQTRTGGATAADIAAQEAAVRQAQANLAQTRTGTATAADIAAQEAAVRQAEANLLKAQLPSATAADIAGQEALVRQAELQLQAAQQGPRPDEVSAAQTKLNQAKDSLSRTAADASAAKTSAYESMQQAADQLRQAQESYSKAFWDNDNAQRGINPATGGSFEDEGLDQEVKQREYAQALRDAELQLSQAQSKLAQAELTFENAKQDEVVDVASAQSSVDDAQVALDELLKGPDPNDVAQAQTSVDQARANLDKLKEGGSAADIASAQASLDQARANLQKLREGGTAAEVAASQASVDQALAQLTGLAEGGSAGDIAASQAQVDQAQAQLEQLTTPKAPTDIEISQAGVTQAEAQLKEAQLNRDKASLSAPFAGTVTQVNVAAGGSSSPSGTTSGAAFALVDASELHVDVNVSEADVALVEEGQGVEIAIDALDTGAISGTVSFIAPAATTEENVTTYVVRVTLPEVGANIRVGMTAAVEILARQEQDVLLVPASAIRYEGTQTFVRRLEGEDFVDVEVRVGLSNDRQTEILSGLEEGDMIAELGAATTQQ